MVTMNKYGDQINHVWMQLFGLSTDTKPIRKFGNAYIGNSSTFYEMDTKKTYMYDEENHQWWDM